MSLPDRSLNSANTFIDQNSLISVRDGSQLQLGSKAEPAYEYNEKDQEVNESTQSKTEDETEKVSMRLLKPGIAMALSRTQSTSNAKSNHIYETRHAEQKPCTYLSQSPTKECRERMPTTWKSASTSLISPTEAPSGLHASNLEARENGSDNSTRAPPERESKGKELETSVPAEDGDSGSEIQSIMDQFDHSESTSDDEVKSSRIKFSSPPLGGSLQHPPRKSSLEPIQPTYPQTFTVHWEGIDVAPPKSSYSGDSPRLQGDYATEVAARFPSVQGLIVSKSAPYASNDSEIPSSPPPSFSLGKPLPPEPDPEPDLPFDFHRFLEQLRHRTADPVAKFLRSFLTEFSKKLWMAHEQVKIISDFLTFIAGKMAQCEVWREVSEAEFDNAKEGMEKLVMNRLYSKTFSPSIPPPVPLPGNKGKFKNAEKGAALGRRGQHQEDIERDDILGQKVRIYSWIQEEHLDIPPIGEHGRRFISLAQQGLRIHKASRQQNDVDCEQSSSN